MNIVWIEENGPPAQSEDAVVAIGNFDGVHLGHQAVITDVVTEARRRVAPACALTLEPHPLSVLNPAAAPKPLMSLAQKAECLSELDLDRLFVLRFNDAAARRTPEEFSEATLRRTICARVVAVGERFRFGWGRGGDASALERLGRAHGFEVHRRPDVMADGSAVSSTRIRTLVRRGDVAEARRLLGRRHFTDGEVVPGRGWGRRMGFATANIAPPSQLIPASGVYAAWCRLRDEGRSLDLKRALVNIGLRPTFGVSEITIEAHILDFEGDLYGKELRIEYQTRMRDELHFDNEDDLRVQILRDRSQVDGILENP